MKEQNKTQNQIDCTHDYVTFSNNDGETCETCGKKWPLAKGEDADSDAWINLQLEQQTEDQRLYREWKRDERLELEALECDHEYETVDRLARILFCRFVLYVILKGS